MEEPGATTSTPEESHLAKPTGPADPSVIAGYAVGVGAVFVATAGVYWNYWQPSASPWAWGGGSFAVGALVGAVWAALRRVRL
jgi:hypothetical protein